MDETGSALERRVRAALERIADPSGGTLAGSDRIEALRIDGGHVTLALVARRDEREAVERAGREAERALLAVDGVARASVVLTAHRAGPASAPAKPAGLAGPAVGRAPKPKLLGGVRRVVAVASGKGGVGKSTVAVRLAVALARRGLATGLLDADIHGPSLPRMLGVTSRAEARDGRLLPVKAFGLHAMSIGFLVEERQAMVWRGPMVMGALEQMMGQVAWPALDVMVVDMPPGTGDAQLTLAQRVDVAGAVIVSTPQDIALIDARRAVSMFRSTNVPVLGVVENMSFLACEACGHHAHPFGHGGAAREAASLGVPFLGEVPLLPAIRMAGDRGEAGDDSAAEAFARIAAGVLDAIA